ncbi:MAG: OmpA family protein [Rubrivivax sp.]
MAEPIFIVDIGPDGIVAVHPQRLQLPVLLSPITEERKASDVNTVREPMVAIACMKLPDGSFEFDSSLIVPKAESRLQKFAQLMLALRDQDAAEPKRFAPISIFGHADPTGRESYNATLSGRRALAVYALLTRRLEIWDTLFKGFGGDEWGRLAARVMLSASLRRPKGLPAEPPFFAGPTTAATAADKAALDRTTDDAIKAYKRARAAELGLSDPSKASASLDTPTRHLLFREYMDAICHDADGNPFVLVADRDFIARDQGTQHKGDVQGCGEFNPIFLLSKEEDDRLNADKELHAARNARYARDRRVVAFVFRHGTHIDPTKWPCPVAQVQVEASAGVLAACKLRFWSDAKTRLAPAEDERVFGKAMELAEPDDDGDFEVDDKGHVLLREVGTTGNTMGCRFYHGFAVYSPCEAKLKEWVVRFRIDGFDKPPAPNKPVPLANRRFVVTLGESGVSAVVRGALDAKGELRIPVLDPHVLINVRLDAWGRLLDPAAPPPATDPDEDPNQLVDGKFPDEDKFLSLTLDAGALKKIRSDEDQDDLASRQRLYNLGFGPPDPARWERDRDQVPAARAYRNSRRLPDSADLRTELEQEHELRDAAPPIDPEDDPTVDPATGA